MNEKQSPLPNVEVHGKMLTPQQMMAVGIAATALATGAANHFDGENGRPKIPAFDIEASSHQQFAEISESPITVERGDGSSVTVVDGRPEAGLVGEVSDTQVQMLGETMEEKWARQFADDVEAGKLINPEEIDNFADAVKAELDNGWSIDGLAFRGTASAEDDTVNEHGVRTAGLQETSPSAADKQAELGDKRRDVGALQFAAAMKERGIDIDPSAVELMPSIEDVLSDDEVALVDQLAQSFGHDSTTQMIEQWNRDPSSVDFAVDTTLTEILAKERTFRVEVTMSRDVADFNEEHGQTPAGIDANPENEGEAGVTEVHDESEASETRKLRFLPIVIPGYVAIAIGRRKLQPGASPESVGAVGAAPVPPVSAPRQRRMPTDFMGKGGVSRNGSGVDHEPPMAPPAGPPSPNLPRAVRSTRDTSDARPRYEDIGYGQKQPRNHNFSKAGGRMAGGSGRVGRDRGGSRLGRRGRR